MSLPGQEVIVEVLLDEFERGRSEADGLRHDLRETPLKLDAVVPGGEIERPDVLYERQVEL